MASGTYRAAVIGLGFIGAGDPVSGEAIGQRVEDLGGCVHTDILAAHPRISLVAGSSRDAGRRQRFHERFPSAEIYADFREMLSREKPDIVSVATNTPAHAEITIACAEAGVRCVFCEKPIATRLSDADRMIEACRSNNTLLVINHNRRWNPVYRETGRRLQEGAVGEPHHLFVYWPTGRLSCVGTHLFDCLRLITGQDFQSVSGTLDTTGTPDCRGSQYRDPGGWGLLTFESGVHAFVEASETLPPKTGMQIQIIGSLGEMIVKDQGCSLRLWGEEAQQLVQPSPEAISMRGAVEEIVTCLDTGKASSSRGEDGRAVLEAIIGFHLSDRQNSQRVSLPIRGSDRDLEVLSG